MCLLKRIAASRSYTMVQRTNRLTGCTKNAISMIIASVIDNCDCLSASCANSGTINTFKKYVSVELELETMNQILHYIDIILDILYFYEDSRLHMATPAPTVATDVVNIDGVGESNE